MAVFEAAEVTAAPVYDIDQFIADPHVQAREIVVELPDAEMGSVPMHDVVPRLSGTPGELRTPGAGARRAHARDPRRHRLRRGADRRARSRTGSSRTHDDCTLLFRSGARCCSCR